MKIAYLCDISPEHTQPYSGGNARIYQALREHVGEVDILPQSWGAAEPVRRAIYALPDGTNLRLRWRLHLLLSRIIARSVTRALNARQYDVVFGAYSFQSMARLKTPYPMLKAFTADASFTVYKRSEIGESFGSSWTARKLIDPLTFREERKIYRNLDLALWPSEWLKEEADQMYGLSDEQSVIVPWGANIDTPIAEAKPLPLSKGAPVYLLVVGRDWFAKGGPDAYRTMQTLRDRGVDARLTVIGTQPPAEHMSEHVTVHRSLNKAIPKERDIFEAAFRNSHFLVQPSFESWGFAFCEAAAYSLPSLCLSVGGVPVQDGVTGHDLPQGAGSAEFSAIIQGYLEAPESYAALRRSSRMDFEERLNWDTWGKTVHDLFEARLSV
ncbi:glycosyltransferase family 4 protein [Lentibacter sp. XHP0401]|uniref:glycosyltransferase family 4 protein n=1 Tax=Lentibacter sp. XHP0401 TaxID=2984334 RepID=UPI0021E976BF|nr:glycosyltransferase family 4 protein [Lentibacter sp. XHP0401]MCV2893400.1 glycosyltransferase family 4 protein [Lentibacter sp. XHP0401]